jgi:hypothetical protein
MIAMPLALLALSWALAIVAGRAKWRNPFAAALGFAVGGLIIGALYPIQPVRYVHLSADRLFALGYAIWRYADLRHPWAKRIGLGRRAVF